MQDINLPADSAQTGQLPATSDPNYIANLTTRTANFIVNGQNTCYYTYACGPDAVVNLPGNTGTHSAAVTAANYNGPGLYHATGFTYGSGPYLEIRPTDATGSPPVVEVYGWDFTDNGSGHGTGCVGIKVDAGTWATNATVELWDGYSGTRSTCVIWGPGALVGGTFNLMSFAGSSFGTNIGAPTIDIENWSCDGGAQPLTDPADANANGGCWNDARTGLVQQNYTMLEHRSVYSNFGSRPAGGTGGASLTGGLWDNSYSVYRNDCVNTGVQHCEIATYSGVAVGRTVTSIGNAFIIDSFPAPYQFATGASIIGTTLTIPTSVTIPANVVWAVTGTCITDNTFTVANSSPQTGTSFTVGKNQNSSCAIGFGQVQTYTTVFWEGPGQMNGTTLTAVTVGNPLVITNKTNCANSPPYGPNNPCAGTESLGDGYFNISYSGYIGTLNLYGAMADMTGSETGCYGNNNEYAVSGGLLAQMSTGPNTFTITTPNSTYTNSGSILSNNLVAGNIIEDLANSSYYTISSFGTYSNAGTINNTSGCSPGTNAGCGTLNMATGESSASKSTWGAFTGIGTLNVTTPNYTISGSAGGTAKVIPIASQPQPWGPQVPCP